MAEPRNLSPKEFRTMQLLELDMLEELDRVCRKMILNTVLPMEPSWELSDIRDLSHGMMTLI